MRLRAAAVALFLLADCGHDTQSNPVAPATPAPLPEAAITMTLNLQPITPTLPHLATWTVVLQETAGVAGTVNFINTTLRDASSGAEPLVGGQLVQDRAAVIAAAGTARIAALGSLSVPGSLAYELSSGGESITLSSVAQITDDNGHFVTGVAQTASQ